MLEEYSLDSRLRGNDRHSDHIVIPAKAGIQDHYPEFLRSYSNTKHPHETNSLCHFWVFLNFGRDV